SSRSLHEMAAVQADIFGIDAAALAAAANQAALSVLDQETKEVLAARRAEKTARNRMLSSLPTWREIREQRGAQLRVEIETTFQAELDRLDALIAASDLNSI